jgi:hypothetical protein
VTIWTPEEIADGDELIPLADDPTFADLFTGFHEWSPLPAELMPFENFTTYLLRELGLADEPTKQQLAICEFMMQGATEANAQKSLRKVLSAFRGAAKSTLGSFRCLHRLRIDPFREKILIPGATADKAVEVTTFMLRCIRDIDILRCLAPLKDGRSSARGFDVGPSMVDQSPSVRAVGILSPSLTGKRCTFAMPDDIETLSNSITPLKQERLATAITELEAVIKPDEGQFLPREILFLGTPHIETSLYLRLHRQNGYAMRFIPARYPNPADPEQWDCYEGFLDPVMAAEVQADPSLVGEPTDPERFDHEELLTREQGMTRARVQLQFQLNCRLSTMERFPIRLGELVVMELDGKALPEVVAWGGASDLRIGDLVCVGLGADRWYHKPALVSGWIPRGQHWNCCLAIDPSGRGRDELAWAVVAELNGNLFLLECGGTTRGYEQEVLEHLAQRALHWQATICLVEENMGGGMFASLLQPVFNKVYPLTIEEVWVSKQKELRICDGIGPLVQQHRLIVSADVVRKDYEGAERDPETGHQRSLFYQLSRVTTERNCLEFDDRADALSLAVNHFVEAAAQDQEVAQERRQDEVMQQELDDWFDETRTHADSLVLGTAGEGRRMLPRKLRA